MTILNKNKLAFIILASLLLCNKALAQADKNFENVFEVYSKLGLIIGVDNLYTANEPNSVSYDLSTSKAFVIGLEYNFYQFKNYNLKLSALYRTEYNLKNYQNFKGEDIGRDFDIGGVLTFGPWSQFKVPLEIQYFKHISDKTFIHFGLGPELIIYPDDPSSGFSLAILEDGTEVGYSKVGYNTKEFYFGLNASIGFGIKTKHFLLKPYFQYHYQPEDLYTIVVTTQNLQSSPNTVSKHTVKGQYLSFGVILNPAKSLFKKSKSGL